MPRGNEELGTTTQAAWLASAGVQWHTSALGREHASVTGLEELWTTWKQAATFAIKGDAPKGYHNKASFERTFMQNYFPFNRPNAKPDITETKSNAARKYEVCLVTIVL